MTEHCPTGYGNPQAWCDWRNAEIAHRGLRWIVGPSGTPMLTDDPVASDRRRLDEERHREDERKRFIWRQMHPVRGHD